MPGKQHTTVSSKYASEGFCTVVVVTTPQGEQFTGCGGSWCDGTCGRPALTMVHDGQRLRVFGSQVARGAVLQPFRRPWVGRTVTLPTTAADLIGAIWP